MGSCAARSRARGRDHRPFWVTMATTLISGRRSETLLPFMIRNTGSPAGTATVAPGSKSRDHRQAPARRSAGRAAPTRHPSRRDGAKLIVLSDVPPLARRCALCSRRPFNRCVGDGEHAEVVIGERGAACARLRERPLPQNRFPRVGLRKTVSGDFLIGIDCWPPSGKARPCQNRPAQWSRCLLHNWMRLANGSTRSMPGSLPGTRRTPSVSARIPGIGPLIGTAIAATVADPAAFRSAREFAAWVGLTPRQKSTGGKQRLGRISRQGDQYIRRLLIIGAQTTLLRSKAARANPWIQSLLAHGLKWR